MVLHLTDYLKDPLTLLLDVRNFFEFFSLSPEEIPQGYSEFLWILSYHSDPTCTCAYTYTCEHGGRTSNHTL